MYAYIHKCTHIFRINSPTHQRTNKQTICCTWLRHNPLYFIDIIARRSFVCLSRTFAFAHSKTQLCALNSCCLYYKPSGRLIIIYVSLIYITLPFLSHLSSNCWYICLSCLFAAPLSFLSLYLICWHWWILLKSVENLFTLCILLFISPFWRMLLLLLICFFVWMCRCECRLDGWNDLYLHLDFKNKWFDWNLNFVALLLVV